MWSARQAKGKAAWAAKSPYDQAMGSGSTKLAALAEAQAQKATGAGAGTSIHERQAAVFRAVRHPTVATWKPQAKATKGESQERYRRPPGKGKRGKPGRPGKSKGTGKGEPGKGNGNGKGKPYKGKGTRLNGNGKGGKGFEGTRWQRSSQGQGTCWQKAVAMAKKRPGPRTAEASESDGITVDDSEASESDRITVDDSDGLCAMQCGRGKLEQRNVCWSLFRTLWHYGKVGLPVPSFFQFWSHIFQFGGRFIMILYDFDLAMIFNDVCIHFNEFQFFPMIFDIFWMIFDVFSIVFSVFAGFSPKDVNFIMFSAFCSKSSTDFENQIGKMGGHVKFHTVWWCMLRGLCSDL
jgi:hypothetical protein